MTVFGGQTIAILYVVDPVGRIVPIPVDSNGVVQNSGVVGQREVTVQGQLAVVCYGVDGNGKLIPLAVDANGAVITSGGGSSNPMTQQDDIIVGGVAGVQTRLGVGADSEVLTVDSITHHVAWKPSAGGFANPMNQEDDIIVGGVGGAGARLGKGADSQVLTVDPATHHLIWKDLPPDVGFANPMNAANDLIVGGALGAPTNKAKGNDSQVLTVDPVSHNVDWKDLPPDVGFANPMIAQDDIIIGGVAGAPDKLTKGNDGQVLEIDSATHHLAWKDLPADVGFANPMNAQDDIIMGGVAGAPSNLAKGSDGQVLTVDPTTHHLLWSTPGAASIDKILLIMALGGWQ